MLDARKPAPAPVDLALLRAWGIEQLCSDPVPAGGATNDTWLLETPGGRYALRRYHHCDRDRVEREHALVAHVQAAGVPAIAPLPTRDGAAVLEWAGRHYALFPHAPGRQLGRSDLALGHVIAMGGMLARIHRALASFPGEPVRTKRLEPDPAATLAQIDALVAVIRARPATDGFDRHVLELLAQQRGHVESVKHAGVEAVPEQMQAIHGDYQEGNVFFEGEKVCAVIDWDNSHRAPRAWDLVRAIDLMLRCAPGPCRAFLDAYQEVWPLCGEELRLGADAYGRYQDHNVWPHQAVYLEGKAQVRAVLPAGDFVPFAARWTTAGLRQ